ncbi:MAG: hypothetical protein ABIS18_00880 [Actinomycetota bacterium]
MHQAHLGDIWPEQTSFPGVAPTRMEMSGQPPLLNAVSLAPTIDPAQMSFGPNQATLSVTVVPPRQLALLPEPAVWEADAPVATSTPKRSRLRKPPDHSQMSLF